jgi:lipopolysaccharide export system protein LptA
MRLPLRAWIVPAAIWAAVAATASVGLAQTSVSLSGLKQDTSLPVEVGSDALEVNQETGEAIFTGNVKVVQGDMTITAERARVEYTPGGNAIDKVFFFGGVLFTSPTDAAEGEEAVYTLASGEVVITGNVLLTQGATTISGGRLVYNLDAGTGVMEGRVQTVFVPGGGTP